MENTRTIPVNANGSVVTFSIKIEGETIPSVVQVLKVAVSKEINKIPYAKIEILDGDAASEDFPVSNKSLFIPGREIEIFAGHQSEEDIIFKGIIVKHGISIRQNGRSVLKLECKDKVFKMATQKTSRYFEEVTDTTAIEQILREYELEFELEDTEVIHPALVQHYCYDWDFVLNRADVNAKFCIAENGLFKMIKPDFNQESVLTLQFGATILEFDAEIDARMQYGMVKTQSWDVANQALLEVEAQEPEIEEPGNLTSEELVAALGLEEFTLKHSGNLLEAELQNWADAKLQRSRLAKIRGRVKFEGFTGVLPGHIITLSGVGDRFNGSVFVSGVRHFLANGEWETDVQFGMNPQWFSEGDQLHASINSGIAPAIQGLQIGTVNQVHDDPNGEFRMLVNTPIINPDEEGVWCRVATIDAGDNRGFFSAQM